MLKFIKKFEKLFLKVGNFVKTLLVCNGLPHRSDGSGISWIKSSVEGIQNTALKTMVLRSGLKATINYIGRILKPSKRKLALVIFLVVLASLGGLFPITIPPGVLSVLHTFVSTLNSIFAINYLVKLVKYLYLSYVRPVLIKLVRTEFGAVVLKSGGVQAIMSVLISRRTRMALILLVVGVVMVLLVYAAVFLSLGPFVVAGLKAMQPLFAVVTVASMVQYLVWWMRGLPRTVSQRLWPASLGNLILRRTPTLIPPNPSSPSQSLSFLSVLTFGVLAILMVLPIEQLDVITKTMGEIFAPVMPIVNSVNMSSMIQSATNLGSYFVFRLVSISLAVSHSNLMQNLESKVSQRLHRTRGIMPVSVRILYSGSQVLVARISYMLSRTSVLLAAYVQKLYRQHRVLIVNFRWTVPFGLALLITISASLGSPLENWAIVGMSVIVVTTIAKVTRWRNGDSKTN